jgi:hypothetical protein
VGMQAGATSRARRTVSCDGASQQCHSFVIDQGRVAVVLMQQF